MPKALFVEIYVYFYAWLFIISIHFENNIRLRLNSSEMCKGRFMIVSSKTIKIGQSEGGFMMVPCFQMSIVCIFDLKCF